MRLVTEPPASEHYESQGLESYV